MDVTALGSVPIPGENPAGFDAKYEPEYGAVLAEIDKLSSATQGGPVSWSNIVEQSRIILETKSKDISIAAYMGVALQKIQGLQGFLDAMNLFISLFSSCWETAFPPLNRLRRRTNAFEWWHEQAYANIQSLENKTASPLPDAFLNELLDAVERLDQLAGELMPDALPLRDLREAVRRLPSLPPEPEAPPKESAEPEPAPPFIETPPVPAQPQTAEPQPVSAQPPPVAPVAEPEPSTPPPGQPSPSAASARLEPAAATPAASPSAPITPPATLSSAHLHTESSDDAKAARKEFVDAACKYAFLAHKEAPHDPLPWQLLRLALWSKVAALPPSENGQTYLPPPDTVRLKALYNLLESGKPPYFNGARITGYHFNVNAPVYELKGGIMTLTGEQTTLRIRKDYSTDDSGNPVLSFHHVAPLSEGAASVVHPIEQFYDETGEAILLADFENITQVHPYYGLCSNQGASGYIAFADLPDSPYYSTHAVQVTGTPDYAMEQALSKGYATRLNVLFVQASVSRREGGAG